MNEFKENLKVDLTHKKDITEKVADAVYKAILDVEAETKQEEIEKSQFLINVNKFIYDFAEDREFRIMLMNYTEKKKYEKYKGEER